MTRMTDAFDDAFAILAAAADVPGCKARIGELKKTLDAIEKAQAQLAADRAAFEHEVAETKAALDRRQARLTEGEVELRLRRNAFDQREARRDAPTSSAADYPENPNLLPGTQCRGLVRDKHYE
jgi:septal ring factor EnvC (AmiA/AmiB activator)